LLLVKNGVPFDLAFSLDHHHRVAFCIIMGELDGGTFNWTQMAFEEPKT
jgi:hypothetical protein